MKAIKSFCLKLNNPWTFPATLTLVLIALTIVGISGSSIGVYHQIFYGGKSDSNLLANNPQSIRSDEWLVNAQKYLAQSNNGFDSVNKNIGLSENQMVISDNPTKDWSSLFKPQNLGFLILPFENAFALKWWLMPYLLAMAVYSTTLIFLRRKYLIASLLSSVFVFSPFLNWWYTNGTFASISLALFGFILLVKILETKRLASVLLFSAAFTYTAVSFVLVLYPPFQIPTAIVVALLTVGFIMDKIINERFKPEILIQKIVIVAISILLVGGLVGLFVYSNKNVVAAVSNSAYPGMRVVTSGGYSAEHLMTGYLNGLLQDQSRAIAYQRTEVNATNQSESSNFIYLAPFILLPLIWAVFRRFKKDGKYDFTLISLLSAGTLYSAWLFIPGLDFLGKITLLDKVPHPRILIGLGLLNLLLIIVYIRTLYDKEIKMRIKTSYAIIYSLVMLIGLLIINFHTHLRFPDFIGFKFSLILALPIPLIVFFLLQRRVALAISIYAIFSFFSICYINPLYKNVDVLSKTPISVVMKNMPNNTNKKWVSEDIIIENFASMNGQPSLTGTYLYPQLDLWSGLDQKRNESIYNRYAHVNFTFDRDINKEIMPVLTNPGPDQMNIKIEPCNSFFDEQKVGFLVTSVAFKPGTANCLSPLNVVKYPLISFYIYKYK